MMLELPIKSKCQVEFIDITAAIQSLLASSAPKNGFCLIFVPHTTAGITINEHADPSVAGDIIKALDHLLPPNLNFSHLEGNSPAHFKASLVGSSVTIMIEEGRPKLGTWQGIFFCEFDGPRHRQVWIKTWPAA
ncbi:MAG TPA: YjbQ family protein [Candidatus Aminicenantes bacterium]|nr:YjbQ family protein [Candidatus Aminicenantes bacterium]